VASDPSVHVVERVITDGSPLVAVEDFQPPLTWAVAIHQSCPVCCIKTHIGHILHAKAMLTSQITDNTTKLAAILHPIRTEVTPLNTPIPKTLPQNQTGSVSDDHLLQRCKWPLKIFHEARSTPS